MTTSEQEMSSERSLLAAMIELACANKGDWESTIQRILVVEARELGVERVSFWAVHDELPGDIVLVCEMAYRRALGAFERGFSFRPGEGREYVEAVVGSSAPLAVEDVRAEPRLRRVLAYLDEQQITSILDCPVLSCGKLAGILSVQHVGSPRRWRRSDQRFAVSVAQTAGAAFEVRTRTEAQRASLRMTFLEQAALMLSQTLDPDEVARRAVALTVPSLGDAARVVVFEDGAPRTAAFDCKTPGGAALLDAAMQERAAAVQYAIAQRDAILVPDLMNAIDAVTREVDPNFIAALRVAGMKSLIAVPMFVGNTVVGVVMLYSASRHFAVDDLGRAEAFANSLAAALENARLHQRLQAALRTREEFIALAGHELRTPLTALQLNAQELVRKAPSRLVEKLGHNILKQATALTRLSARMLDAVRASKFRFSFVTAPTDLAAVAREAAASFGPALEQRGSELVLHADEPVVGDWDGTQLDAVLSYLLDNAAKFGAGRPVEVTVQREGDAATLSVRDHGPGIPPDRLPHIFEVFERAVSADHYGGLGLGLFLTKAIVEGHGGRITVENLPGDGVMFTARLPLHSSPRA